MSLQTLTSLIPKLAQHRILVAGDVILDEYITGTPGRLSREAPIPVLEFKERRYIPGGAANPASNIVALGSEAVQAGIIGEDAMAAQLRQALQDRGIDAAALVTCADRPTTLKTRLLAQMGLRFPQQVARIDTLSRTPILPETEQAILAHIRAELPTVQAVLFSDYQSGMLTPSLVTAVRNDAGDKLLTADAQGALEKYHGWHVVKCNADDARDYLRRDLQTDAEFAAAAHALCQQLQLTGAMVITRGAAGATLAQADGTIQHCPAPAVSDVFDTVGAGDTAIAVLTLALLAGAAFGDAVMLANVASGIVVRHVGNYTPTPQELQAALG
jgi:rfaE bifunctional protein kinase chain/domain